MILSNEFEFCTELHVCHSSSFVFIMCIVQAELTYASIFLNHQVMMDNKTIYKISKTKIFIRTTASEEEIDNFFIVQGEGLCNHVTDSRYVVLGVVFDSLSSSGDFEVG